MRSAAGRSGGMGGLADWCIRHARLVLAGWCVAAAAAVTASTMVGAHYRTEFRLPGTDSQRASDLIRSTFPDQRGDSELLVLATRTGSFRTAAERAAAERLFDRLRAVPDVSAVTDPFRQPRARLVAADARTAVAFIRFRQATDEVPLRSVRDVIRLAGGAGQRFDVGLAGQAVENAETTTPGASEGLALLVAVAVLLVGFGSATAVGLALATTFLALAVGFGTMSMASHLLAIPTFATQIATTIGLGVGIDYSLLVLARYRANAHAGMDPHPATVAAMRTAGRAVVFAGGTVMLAMLGLYAVGLPFVHGMAFGVILVVVPTILAATTVLPALLGRHGRQLNRWQPPGLRGRQLTGRSAGWARWAGRVQGHPVTAIAFALTILGLLAAPALSMRLDNAQASTDNNATITHRGYALTRAAFGPGLVRPFQVVASGPTASTAAVTATTLRATAGVAAVGPPELGAGATAVLVTVYPDHPPTAPQTADLLHRLRGPVRESLARQGVRIAVGGPAATGLDLADTVGHGVPVVLAAVIGTSLLLLIVLFRSLVVAVKAGLMNLLSIAAAFGVVVAVFQWGWGRHLVGVNTAGPIEVFLPLLLFPTVFGLSMDYEVFLLTRIRDEWDATHDNGVAVTEGLATTGRVVTAGAAIMVVLFGSLVFANARTVKVFGLGLACAILLDAVLVRSVLLPATMALLGRRNWWLPRWLDRLLPRVATEGRAGAPISTK